MIAHVIFWPTVRCDARRIVDLQWRQRRWDLIVAGAMQFVYTAFSRRFNSGSALCGKATRDYTFITANSLYFGMPPPPALYRLWKRLNCFGLIKAPKYHPTASKPGANRLDAPINIPNSQFCRTFDAHVVQKAVSLRVQRRSHGICVLSDFTQVQWLC
jgi:hypothetical protein